MSRPTVIAHTALGDYEGPVQDGVAAFKGIPYALAPFGARRFLAPEPVGPHEGVLACHDYGPTAPKGPYRTAIDTLLAEPTVAGEDCLNLNVWTPETAPTTASGSTAGTAAGSVAGSVSGSGAGSMAGLPVLVWVHGGAFVHGSGAVSTYDGTSFARDGLVCVTINYRLGVDGFLLLDGVPANRGLLDQIAALEWVRAHIAGFGGDPDRVTVAGESAGAMSIGTLLAMPAAQGLFQQAITQSGAASHVLTAATARRVRAGLAERLGIAPTAEAFAAVALPELTAAQEGFSARVAAERNPRKWAELARNAMPFEPAVDGEVLPGPPLDLIQAGAGSSVRLLTGTNREEMTFFLAPTGLLEAADDALLQLSAGLYGLGADGVAVYQKDRPEATPGELIVDLVTDWFFRIPALRLAEARAGLEAPTYVYEFDWRTPQWDGRLGATHTLEVAFVFDTLDDPAGRALLGPNPPQQLADRVHSAWVAFAATGEPGWPRHDDRRIVQTLGVKCELILDPRPDTRAAWDGLR